MSSRPVGRLLAGLVRVYQLVVSPWLGPNCRFEPSCSAYAIEALRTHGAARGGWLTLRRLARCQPFCAGGYDPVPEPRRFPTSGSPGRITSGSPGRITSGSPDSVTSGSPGRGVPAC